MATENICDENEIEEIFSPSRAEDDLEKDGHELTKLSIGRNWNGRLVTLQIKAMNLQYLIATLSTLGGAYHLCNNTMTALLIAQRSELVAQILGSSAHLLRSRTYQAVNLYLLGKVKTANALFKKCKQDATKQGNVDMVRFIEASETWVTSSDKVIQQVGLIDNNAALP